MIFLRKQLASPIDVFTNQSSFSQLNNAILTFIEFRKLAERRGGKKVSYHLALAVIFKAEG